MQPSAKQASTLDEDFIIKAPVCPVIYASPQESTAKYGPRGKAPCCVQEATMAATSEA